MVSRRPLCHTFGGEIYNYRELRTELESKGRAFSTETDTEVLLTAFAEWSTQCLARLNGMFHFAVWDNEDRTLTLARDHVGIKPLYYFYQTGQSGQPGSFIFASEVKAILATGLVPRALDTEALHQFLTFLWAPDPNTLFQGIKTLPPGHVLEWRDDEVSINEWWDVSFAEIEEGRSEAWWQEQVLETLDKVVRMEMVADVPLGSFLSGGIDSSGIVAMMKHHSNGRKVSTYTVGITAEDLRYDIIPDDVQWARRVNEHLQTTITRSPCTLRRGLLPKLIYHLTNPSSTWRYRATSSRRLRANRCE